MAPKFQSKQYRLVMTDQRAGLTSGCSCPARCFGTPCSSRGLSGLRGGRGRGPDGAPRRTFARGGGVSNVGHGVLQRNEKDKGNWGGKQRKRKG